MIYTLIFFYLLIFSIYFDLYFEQRQNNDFSLRLIYFLLFLVAAFRYRLAPDSVFYEYYVRELVLDFSDLTLGYLAEQKFQPLWIFISSISKSLGSYLVLQVAVSYFVLMTIYKFIKRYTIYQHSATLVFYMVFYHYLAMEILRESIAIALFLWAVIYSRKNSALSLIFIFMAFLFHRFALILMPLFLIVHFRFSTRFVFFSSVIVVLLMSLLKAPLETIQLVISILIPTVSLSGYEVEKELSLFGYIYFVIKCVIPLLIVYYSARRLKVMANFPVEKQYFISFTLIFASLVVIRITSVPFIERIMNYVLLFVIVLSVEAIVTFLRYQQSYIRLLVGIATSFLVAAYSILPMLNVNPNTGMPSYIRYYPYFSYISMKVDPRREYLIRLEAKEP